MDVECEYINPALCSVGGCWVGWMFWGVVAVADGGVGSPVVGGGGMLGKRLLGCSLLAAAFAGSEMLDDGVDGAVVVPVLVVVGRKNEEEARAWLFKLTLRRTG